MSTEILQAVQRAGRPSSLEQLLHHVPGLRRDDLDRLVERGVLYPCTRRRYWDRDETEAMLSFARGLVKREPMTRQELIAALGERDPALPRSFRESIYDQLKRSEGIWEWPGGAGRRASRLATRAPDPEPYVRAVRSQFAKVRARLTEAGVPEAAIVAAVMGDAPPSASEPAPRPDPPSAAPTVLHEIAFAWADAEGPAARAPLERILVNIGAERLGEPDQTVAFDGRFHETDDDLFPDEPASVVEPGWVHGAAQQRMVIVKARVRAAS